MLLFTLLAVFAFRRIARHPKLALCGLLLLGMAYAPQQLTAQTMPRTVVGSSGEYFDNLLFGTLNFTVGEVAVKRYQGTMDLAEGFHRVYYDLIVSNDDRLPTDWAVKVYPNPATEYLRIELPDVDQLVNAQLFGSTGQLLLQQENINSETDLDLQNLPAGTYWLRLLDEHGRQGSFQIQKVLR